MNLPLQKEIISHIFKNLGIIPADANFRPSFTDGLIQDKFLIGKKLAFETEDGEKHQNNIWGTLAAVGGATIKIIVADVSDGYTEYTMLVQMDDFQPHALNLSKDNEDFGTISVAVGDTDWANTGTLIQAKLLSGIEALSEFMVEWKKLEDYNFLYKKLIMFLNFQEENK